MELEIDLEKSVEENASLYFDKSKKAKKKLEGLMKAIEATKGKLEKLEGQKPAKGTGVPVKKAKKQWFQEFHWFKSSDGFLVVGGRSAKSNEIIVSRHLQKGDMFLHADIPGAAACVVKAEGREIPRGTLEEAAQFSAAYSRAWQAGISSVDVYAVPPEQVSKTPPSGMSLGKGSFMIYGKREWFKKTKLELAVGVLNDRGSFSLVAGPRSAVEKQPAAFVVVKQGGMEKNAAAKKIFSMLAKKAGSEFNISLDEINTVLPAGGLAVAGG